MKATITAGTTTGSTIVNGAHEVVLSEKNYRSIAIKNRQGWFIQIQNKGKEGRFWVWYQLSFENGKPHLSKVGAP
jgi:hypothetical protein